MPIGTWHETRSHSDSFALILAVRTPRVGETILSVLDQELRGNLCWRQEIWGTGVEGAGVQRSRRGLLQARRALGREVMRLTVPTIEHALARRQTRFFFCVKGCRGVLRRFALAMAEPDRGHYQDRALMQELLAWIELNAEGFDAEEAASAVGLDALGVGEVLDELVAAGAMSEV